MFSFAGKLRGQSKEHMRIIKYGCMWQQAGLWSHSSELVATGRWKDELHGNIVRKWAVCFLVWRGFFLLIFIYSVSFWTAGLASSTAANIFVSVHVSWQFLGLWVASQGWAYWFPKHLCCFSCSFLETPGNEVRGPDSSCRHWRAAHSASA